MKVRELIGRLRQMPPDAEVLLEDWNEQYRDPTELEAATLMFDGTVVLGGNPIPVEA